MDNEPEVFTPEDYFRELAKSVEEDRIHPEFHSYLCMFVRREWTFLYGAVKDEFAKHENEIYARQAQQDLF